MLGSPWCFCLVSGKYDRLLCRGMQGRCRWYRDGHSHDYRRCLGHVP
ncbi:hypothetical protein I311_01502 [Cryptococcus gattii NT-10]|nr:hypothetical protein I311_01502 [Cryptococcus gattii NT-10]